MINFQSNVEAVDNLRKKYLELREEMGKKIYGQEDVLEEVIISIFSRGHCLIVGVPGLAKTLLVNTIAEVLGLKNKRIQFTPDLMPSDIIGTEILGEDRQFKFIRGPIFANFILADEINRTPPKTQSALLEAMQERSVTVAGNEYKLDEPFFVMATQNPIEQEGTYPLPEAQLDRFMFNILVDYPNFKEEIEFFKNLIRKVPINDNVLEYAVKLVEKTRPNSTYAHEHAKKYLQWGAGPRASQYLIIGAKAHAVLNGKYSPDIENVKAVAKLILRHRIIKNYKAEAENITIDDIIDVLMND